MQLVLRTYPCYFFFENRNSVLLRLVADMCVGSSRCCVLLLGHSSSFQLPTVQTLGEDSYCPHHLRPTGSVRPTTNWIATSCGWLYTVLFTSIILFTTEQVLWLLHFITPNLHFCWNHDIHADLHHMDHIQGINYNYGKNNNYEQEP